MEPPPPPVLTGYQSTLEPNSPSYAHNEGSTTNPSSPGLGGEGNGAEPIVCQGTFFISLFSFGFAIRMG